MPKLYFADVSGLDIEIAAAKLPPHRLNKMNRLPRTESKKLSAGAYLLFIRACELNGLSPEYEVGANGKPDFIDGTVHFSLSHSGNYAVCAISDKPVGVDIEIPRSGSLRIAERFFAPDELTHIKNAADPDDEFCRVWTMKESYIKALGLTLSSLDSFSVLKAVGCAFFNHRFNAYNISVCTVGEDTAAELLEITDLC